MNSRDSGLRLDAGGLVNAEANMDEFRKLCDEMFQKLEDRADAAVLEPALCASRLHPRLVRVRLSSLSDLLEA